MTTITTNSPEETQALAASIAAKLTPGAVIGLVGPLGAGKTCFIQGLARGLGVPATTQVNSPTYILMNIYEGKYPIYHFDWYRLVSAAALTQLGLEEYFEGDGITVIEWADKFPEALPVGATCITLTPLADTARALSLPEAWI